MENTKKHLKLYYKIAFSNIGRSYLKTTGVWVILSILILSILKGKSIERVAVLNILFLVSNIVMLLLNLIYLMVETLIGHMGKLKSTIFLGGARKQYYKSNILSILTFALFAVLVQGIEFITSNLIIGNIYKLTFVNYFSYIIMAYIFFCTYEFVWHMIAMVGLKLPYFSLVFCGMVFVIIGLYGRLGVISKVLLHSKEFIGISIVTSIITISIGWLILSKADIN